MARNQASGMDGAVTMPTLHGGDIFSWSLAVAARNKDTTIYGGGRFSRWKGGLFDSDVNIGAFIVYGTSNTAPGLYSMAIDGSTLTLQAATGCTYGGTAVFTNGAIDHTVGDPAAGLKYTCKFSGTVTETWAVA